VTVWIIAPAGEKRAFVAIYVIGYVLRLLAIVLVHQISLSGLIFADDRGYDEQARYLASDWSLSNLNFASAELGTTHTGYPILLSTLYAFLGPSVFSAKVLSALFGALTAPVAFFLAVEVTGEQRTGRLAAWLAAFFLYDVMWAGFLMKDTVLIFLFTSALLACVKLAKQRSLAAAAACIVLFAALQLFRFYAIATIALAGLVALVVGVSQFDRLRSGRARLWLGAAAMAMVGATVSLVWAYYGDSISVLAVYAKAIDQFQAVPGGEYSLLQFSPTFSFIKDAAKAALVYQLGPFAWIFSGVDLGGILFYPGMYLIYALLPYFLLGFGKMAREITPTKAFILAALILHAVAEIFMYQAGERQRVMTDVLFVICAVVGWHARLGKHRFVMGTYAALVAFALAHMSLGLL